MLPYLDLAAEANARGYVARSVACGCDMVAAELVGSFELLLEGEGGLDGAVDANGGGTAGGEEGCGCRSDGEYLGRMGCLGVVLASGSDEAMVAGVFEPLSTVWTVRYCFDCGGKGEQELSNCHPGYKSYHRYLSMGCVVEDLL